VLVVKGKVFKITSVYQKSCGTFRIERSSEGGANTIVHGTAGTLGGMDNTSFQAIPASSSIKISERFLILRNLTSSSVYRPGMAMAEPRIVDAATSLALTPASRFQPGDRCLAKFKLSRNYFKGIIVKHCSVTETYHVKFDTDGDEDFSVSWKHIKRGSKETFEVD
jgi:hypothetical protein